MPPNKGENTKKSAGNAKKAAAAAQKQATADAAAAAAEDAKWATGSRDTSKKTAAAEKAADAQRKKAEKAALLAEEEADAPARPPGGKTAVKKKGKGGGGLDLSLLEASGAPELMKKEKALNARGIDDALDALALTGAKDEKIDRHPERRFKAAYAAFEARRLAEMKDEGGLRRQQKVELIRKEFEKSAENPFNAMVGRFDMSKEEMAELRQREKEGKEARLTQAAGAS